MNIDKMVDRYAKIYCNALYEAGMDGIKEKEENYRKRLGMLYASALYEKHNVYPSMNVELIYAVIAMCLELKDYGFADEQIIGFSNVAFKKKRELFDKLLALIDRLPFAFAIARKWNIQDHEKRVQDGSITYDRFQVNSDCIEYRISKCRYVEMFETYGIRGLCKIFCNTDTRAYAGLTRHVRFIRHSDLADGDCCFDQIYKRG